MWLEHVRGLQVGLEDRSLVALQQSILQTSKGLKLTNGYGAEVLIFNRFCLKWWRPARRLVSPTPNITLVILEPSPSSQTEQVMRVLAMGCVTLISTNCSEFYRSCLSRTYPAVTVRYLLEVLTMRGD